MGDDYYLNMLDSIEAFEIELVIGEHKISTGIYFNPRMALDLTEELDKIDGITYKIKKGHYDNDFIHNPVEITSEQLKEISEQNIETD